MRWRYFIYIKPSWTSKKRSWRGWVLHNRARQAPLKFRGSRGLCAYLLELWLHVQFILCYRERKLNLNAHDAISHHGRHCTRKSCPSCSETGEAGEGGRIQQPVALRQVIEARERQTKKGSLFRSKVPPPLRRYPQCHERETNKERVIFPFKSPASVAPLPTMPRAHDSWVMKCAAWRAITLGVRIVERSGGFSGGTDSIRIHIQERDFDGVLVYVGLGERAGYSGWTSIKGDGKGVRNIWPILYFVNFSVNICGCT